MTEPKMQFDKISVIGLGYIGLPTAAMFASHAVKVVGVDIRPDVVATINEGRIHIVEPGLEDVVRKAVESGMLSATTVPEAADAFIIAVPTPFKSQDHEPDLSYIDAACRSIAPVLAKGNLVILESTSPVGATDWIEEMLAELRPDLHFPRSSGENTDIFIAHCPERVLPGKVMAELISNDRVIGGVTKGCAEAAVALYNIFVEGECVIASSPKAAEMAKLTENSFRDVNIAFANELSLICDKLDINVWELIQLANRHPRVDILQPGPGVGGHCIAVDPWFIVHSAPEEAKLIATARNVNDAKPEWVLEKLRTLIANCLTAQPDRQLSDIVIACYGLAFKPDIDDLRDSPALAIAKRVAEEHIGPVLLIEPNVSTAPKGLGRAELCNIADAQTADIHLLLVDHKEFRAIARPKGKILDTRGLWKQAS
ncbi:UDP-N-acetyl-D-mannosamine dehydrogenase [Sphingorhabdus sp.]|uniref:UDP-N-acetyl-D-mannosamine dehydrogenase n=1 Tax=Sphingorhabdus sp. TaxID=1902408 RepID=UPI0032B6FB7F